LTAFAQLGALRLDAKRGVITVSAKDREYIIAESGQRLSLQQDDDEDDKLWHGVGWLAQTGMAQEFATIFSAKDAPSHIYVGDLSKDERFKDTEAVTGLRHIRAIACVPLKTPLHGITIGAYFVVDDRARDEPCLGPRNVEYMQDMAVTIMDYLEANRMKRQQYRAERMVKAIGLFIEGKASLREWWLDHGHKYQHTSSKKRSKGSDALLEEADREFGVQEVTDYFSRSTLSGLNENTSRFSGPPSPSSSGVSGDRGDGRPAMPRGDTLLSDNTTSSPALVSQSWHERNSSVTTFDTIAEQTHDMEKQPSVSFDLPPENVTGDLSRELQNAVLSSEVRGVFARSSNLIREAIGVEGVIYFDASVGSFGGSSDKNAVEEKAPGAFHVDKAATSSEDEIGKKVSDLENGEEVKLWEEQAAESTEKYCNVLGFSTRQRSTLRGHAVSEEHQRMPEAVLRKLLKRYPHGKVFNFDEEGSLSSSESDNKASLTPKDAQSSPNTRTESIARRNRISREAEAKTILSVLPGARSVFWFPLWDQNRERWFSGSLIWSTCPTRTLCPVEDITYLAAFGNSTMAEIARLSAAVLSKMKTDFISSISHELRSPLHGVLASVEFLQETEMTEVQADMVSNIHASGKVLLDTINHVLDFSKVNRKTKNRKRMAKRRLPKKGGRRHSIDESTEEKADVCLLSEEVIESIYAGASIGKKAFDSMGHRQHKVSGTKEPPITIIVDIAWRSNWTFEIDAGAWRRVLMNLFNNAMKYTKHGFVKVSMEIEEDVSSQKKNPRSNLTLRVKDSGKGISQEFLRHQLYKPFTQEDNLATGAGLGLSIVKAIIQDLGGRIDFVSEPGVGTEATVQIPLTSATPVDLEKWNIVNEIKEKVSGFRFRLDGFERYPEISEIPTGILSPDAQAAMLLKSSMQSSLTEWFGMQPAPLTLDAAGSDLVVIMEAGLGNISLEDMLQSHPLRTEKAVAIVLTNSYHSGPKVDSHNHFRIFYLPQP
jgi:signal transduction histidine kinase